MIYPPAAANSKSFDASKLVSTVHTSRRLAERLVQRERYSLYVC